jgi:hypothetical protein
MATDQQFIKKEYKDLSVFEKVMHWLIPLLAILCLVLTTLFLFVWKQECGGIDKEFAYCYVHPASVIGIFGLILFYIGGLWVSSIIPYILIKLGVPDDSLVLKVGRVLAFICMLGFFLIYI